LGGKAKELEDRTSLMPLQTLEQYFPIIILWRKPKIIFCILRNPYPHVHLQTRTRRNGAWCTQIMPVLPIK
jgi:hypothetical protein